MSAKDSASMEEVRELSQTLSTAQPVVSVVLPCLNEEGSVGLCVREALDALEGAGIPGEVVVVDNGSTDASTDVAIAAGARVVRERREGYGSALQAGFRAARGDVIVMAGADLTYELTRIPDLVRPVLEGEKDLVLGARLQDATRGSMPLLHRFVGTPLLTFLVARAAGGLSVGDSQSGFRAFRREAILRLPLRGTGMEFASEMLIQAARADWRIHEIQTTYRTRVGESKLDTFADGWRHMRLITLLAPDLILVYPGAAILTIGLLLSIWRLIETGAIAVGSIHWQPVFFSTIAIVLGAQALIAGLVMAHLSSLAATSSRRRFAFVGRPMFPRRCIRGGALGALAGLGIDVGLLGWWLTGHEGLARSLAFASLAQSLLIVGSGLASFGVVTRLILDRRQSQTGAPVLGLDDFAPLLPDRERGLEGARA